jgi:sulfotransferase
MSGANEFSVGVEDQTRARVIRGAISAFYKMSPESNGVVFDTNRAWTANAALISALFPEAKIVCCLRSPAWIVDSTERNIQRNPLLASRLLGYEVGTNVYERVEKMMSGPYLGGALRGLKEAWYGPHRRRLIGLRYESIADNPKETMAKLYAALDLSAWSHDVGAVASENEEFDRGLGIPGFHSVRPSVGRSLRETILPPELFKTLDDAFWTTLPGESDQMELI